MSEVDDISQIIATLHREWSISTTFDPAGDYGRGIWIATVTESVAGSQVEVATATSKLPFEALIFAAGDAVAKAGGARFF